MRLIGVLLAMVVLVGTATAQTATKEKVAKATDPPTKTIPVVLVQPSVTPTGTVPIPSPTDQLKFSRLQFEQAKIVLRLQDLEREAVKARAENDEVLRKMTDWLNEQAKALKIDMSTHTFDFTNLVFVPKPVGESAKKPSGD